LSAGAGALAVWPYVSDESALAFARIQAAREAPAPVFLSAAQYAAVDAIAETIIPADEKSPGARAARVVDYIDLLLSESDPATQQTWSAGLVALDQASRARYSRTVAELTPEEATALLTGLSVNEASPRTPLEEFFKATKDATIRGYYTSEIGIHQDLKYQGNRMIAEFTGCTHPEHGYTPSGS
jgi:hypothetical protein